MGAVASIGVAAESVQAAVPNPQSNLVLRYDGATGRPGEIAFTVTNVGPFNVPKNPFGDGRAFNLEITITSATVTISSATPVGTLTCQPGNQRCSLRGPIWSAMFAGASTFFAITLHGSAASGDKLRAYVNPWVGVNEPLGDNEQNLGW
jgi:hypothetical protein